jgi:glycosyltransferase involved in cell wall biosynthesis
MRIAILAIHIRGADAVGLQLIQWIRMLHELGHTTELYVEQIGRDVPPDVLAITVAVDGATFQHSPYWTNVQRADLVICDYPAYFDLAESLRLLTGPPILWSYHGVTPPDQWLDNEGRRYLEMSRRRTGLVHFTHLAVTRSAWTREELHHLTGFPRERIAILPCIVPEPPVSTAGVAASSPYILHVGRVAAHKRPEMLVEALAMVRHTIPAAQLVFAGDARGPSHAPVVDSLRRRAVERGIAHAVHFTGSVEPALLERLYRRAAVVASASAHEGFCVPVIEAMARGVPTVVSATAALPDTVGDAGFIVPDQDIAALAAAIVDVLQDHSLRARLVERGQAHARSYRSDALSDQLAALIQRTVAQPHHNRERPRLGQLVDLPCLHAAAEVAPAPIAPARHILRRGAAHIRRWFQSDVRRQLDDLVQHQVAYNRQVAHTLHVLDEWTADVSEQQAAALHDNQLP